MKIDYDCMRDELLYLEENLKLNTELDKNEIIKALDEKDYEEDEIIYNLIKLEEAGFVKAYFIGADDDPYLEIIIEDITYVGHQYLNSVREKDIWQKWC